MARTRILAAGVAAAGLAAALVAMLLPAVALAADPSFGAPTATSKFLTGVTFRQPVSNLAAGSLVEIVIDQQGSSTSFVAVVRPGSGASQTLGYVLELPSGAAVPGTTFTARWRLTAPNAESVLGPPVSVVYADDRFAWRTVSGDIVRMHWYEGSAAFGRQALEIAEAGVEDAATLLGVDEREPIDFYLYADVEPFYDALGPGSRENVGGVAYSEVRTMLAQINPGGINDSWIRTVIPHELTHIVFAEAVDNPYHFPPKWLNEGLAVYQSEGYQADRKGDVDAAVAARTLMPLTALTGQFPTSFARFVLAYAESVSAVDYLIRTYGKDKLVALVRSYADGVSDDAAFDAALGVNVTGFEAGWLADLGASAPEAFGPQPAPPGPLPPGWEVVPTAGPSPSVSAAPSPSASPTPVDGETGGPGVVIGAVLVALAGLGVVATIWWQRRQRSATLPSVPAEPPPDLPPPPPPSEP